MKHLQDLLDIPQMGRRYTYTPGETAILEGPAAVRAMDEVRKNRQQKHDWPYIWSYPPPSAVRVTAGADASGTLAMPASGQVLSYTVDEGTRFILTKLVVLAVNAGTVNPGDFTWSLTLNSPVGVPNFQALTVQGYNNVDVGLGTLQIPWPLECPEEFEPNDDIRVVVTNVNLTGGFIKAILLGWRVPVV